MTIKEGLQSALALFGPNGETWSQGAVVVGTTIVPEGKHCAMTACMAVKGLDFEVRMGMVAVLQKFAKSSITHYNDTHTFEDIRALFNTAIADQGE